MRLSVTQLLLNRQILFPGTPIQGVTKSTAANRTVQRSPTPPPTAQYITWLPEISPNLWGLCRTRRASLTLLVQAFGPVFRIASSGVLGVGKMHIHG